MVHPIFITLLFWHMCIYLDIVTTKKMNNYHHLTRHIWTPVPSYLGGGEQKNTSIAKDMTNNKRNVHFYDKPANAH